MDMQSAQEECLLQVGTVAKSFALPAVTATFFSFKNKKRFQILFWFSNDKGVITYPLGKLNWTFKNIYGDMTYLLFILCI